MSCSSNPSPPACEAVLSFNNADAGQYNFFVQAGSEFLRYFRFYEGPVDSTTPIDLSLVEDIVLDLKNGDEEVTGSYRLGEGFLLDNNDPTLLIMYKQEDEKNFPWGTYQYHLRIQYSSIEAAVPIFGSYTSVGL